MSTLVHSQSQPLSLLFPPNPAFLSNPPSGGILINSSRSPSSSPASRTASLPITPENYGRTHPLPLTDRKIRFAPLPEPRKYSDGDDDSPLDEDSDTKYYRPDSAVVTISLSSHFDGEQEREREREREKERESRWGKKLFKPFLNASPVKPSFDDSSGMKNLWRAGSRESIQSNATSGAGDQDSNPGSVKGLPFRRKSASSSDRPAPPSSQLAPSNSLSSRPSITAGNTEAPKKLLNGRVYGGRKSQSRERDTAEPEFVEWGYGGMGSVRSGERYYSGVQSSSSSVFDDEGEDDGSGMGWVRRRREERIRKEREDKERALAEDRKMGGDRERDTDTDTPVITVHSPPSTPNEEKSHLPPPFTHTPSSSSASTTKLEHETATVAVPHHHISRALRSGTTTPTVGAPGVKRQESSSSAHGGAGMQTRDEGLHISTQSLDGSGSDDEEEDDEDNDNDNDEDDSSSSEEDEMRKTTTCAGVEKVSRHRE